MTRYQTGFNPFVGGIALPKTDAVESAKDQLVAGSAKKVSAAKPFHRIYDMWATAFRLAHVEDLDPSEFVEQPRRKFHDNLGTLIGGDLPLMALIATTAVEYRVAYEGQTFEEAIEVLDEPGEQIKIADYYAHAGMVRLLELITTHRSAPGPAITRVFQKALMGSS